MIVSATELLSLYLFDAPRRVFCLNLMLERLPADVAPRLRRLLEDALVADRATCELEAHWKGSRRQSEHPVGATELDAELDHAVKALDDVLATSLKAFGEDSARGRSASLARARLFPKGVREVTRQPFVKQTVLVETLLRRVAAEPELGAALDQLGARVYVERVEELNARFHELLQLDEDRELSFAELRQARAAGQEAFSRAVFHLVARLTTEEVSAWETLALEKALQAVLDQNAKIKRLRQRRRRPLAIDPETGEELLPTEPEIPESGAAETAKSEEEEVHPEEVSDPAEVPPASAEAA